MFKDMSRKTNTIWFLIALIGGGIGVWLAKKTWSTPWGAALVAAGVVLALALYYILNEENAPEEEGDNVYYLGLLFTLISIVFSLLELFESVKHDTKQIDVLLENFGIALTSTIAGIALRVLVLNCQPVGSGFTEDTVIPEQPPSGASSSDLEQFNRHLLNRIARDLTQSANALARFHRIVRSHASDSEEFLRNHSKTLKQESMAFRKEIQSDVEIFTRDIKEKSQKTLDSVGDSLGAASRQTETMLERLESAHDDYLANLRAIIRSFYDEIQSASNKSLDVVAGNLNTTTKQSRALIENISDLPDRMKTGLARIGTDLEGTTTTFSSNANRVTESITNLGEETEKLRTTLAAIHTGADSVTSATKKATDAAQALGATLESLQDTREETMRAAKAFSILAEKVEAQAEAIDRGKGSLFRFFRQR